jgi:hypothetical protein
MTDALVPGLGVTEIHMVPPKFVASFIYTKPSLADTVAKQIGYTIAGVVIAWILPNLSQQPGVVLASFAVSTLTATYGIYSLYKDLNNLRSSDEITQEEAMSQAVENEGNIYGRDIGDQEFDYKIFEKLWCINP